MFSLQEVQEIVRPAREKIEAEHRAAEMERKYQELMGRIFDLQSALGDCYALMNHDVQDGVTRLTPTRAQVIERARSLSR
jgi:hypothetical protein